MKRAYLALAASMMMSLGLTLPQAPALAGDPIKIAVVTHGQSSDSYWSVVKKGVDDAAKLLGPDVSVTYPRRKRRTWWQCPA